MHNQAVDQPASQGTRLDALFRIAERYRRSVNVALDLADDRALDAFILTPLVQSVALRVAEGLAEGAQNRAWSLTGPYGAGKSAAVLLLAQALGYPETDSVRQRLRAQHPEFLAALLERIPDVAQGGFVIVPMVGSHQPLALLVAQGLLDTLRRMEMTSPELERQMAALDGMCQRLRSGADPDPEAVARALEQAAQALRQADPHILGILLVVDELGRALEYAAMHPSQSDVGLLQEVSEVVSRTTRPTVGLLTVLHQAFEHYLHNFGRTQQDEWAKIKGRFAEIAFLQSPAELLHLMGQAIQAERPHAAYDAAGARHIAQARAIELIPDGSSGQEYPMLVRCAPLHPTTALALGPLFRSRLAQNERSLFAFLSSGEPHGFQQFLRTHSTTDTSAPFYRLDMLYDYVLANLGSGLYSQSRGKQWAEIEEALGRLPRQANALDARLVKAIGMLELVGDKQRLRSSEAILTFGLSDETVRPEDITGSLKRLCQWSIVVHREYRDAYALWQGSDIDLDASFEQGLARIDRSAKLSTLIQDSQQIRPYMAKRHLHKTGTFRVFVPWIVDLDELETVRDRALEDADGAFVFVLHSGDVSVQEAVDRVQAFSASLSAERQELCLFAVPTLAQGIREAFCDLAAWDWVANNTPALHGDGVARRELSARRMATQLRLLQLLRRSFDPSEAHGSCRWVWGGQEQSFGSARQLADALSDACDRVYRCCPLVHNELINRRTLSSAAAAARRALIERLLNQGSRENLGLEGYPPEMSMYLSVIHASGLHQRMGDSWVFAVPKGQDPSRVRPLFRAIESYLDTTEGHSRPVTELYRILGAAPFGIKQGLLPLYLVLALLIWQSDTALYEEGSFIPQVRVAEIERLLRVPERFSVQRYRLDNTRLRVLHEYARLFNRDVHPAQVRLVDIVRRLVVSAAQWPEYTRRTGRLSADAQAIRPVLLQAREPQPLLYDHLPKALGYRGLDGETSIEPYFARLRAGLIELQNAYVSLLSRIESELLQALRLPAMIEQARTELANRVSALDGVGIDLRLQGFVSRLADDHLADREWLESLATVVVSKPPAQWHDGDERRFQANLVSLTEQLRRLQEIALARGAAPKGSRVLRLGVTDGTGAEAREVMHVRPGDERAIERALMALRATLSSQEIPQQAQLVTLAELAKELLQQRKIDGEDHDQ